MGNCVKSHRPDFSTEDNILSSLKQLTLNSNDFLKFKADSAQQNDLLGDQEVYLRYTILVNLIN